MSDTYQTIRIRTKAGTIITREARITEWSDGSASADLGGDSNLLTVVDRDADGAIWGYEFDE